MSKQARDTNEAVPSRRTIVVGAGAAVLAACTSTKEDMTTTSNLSSNLKTAANLRERAIVHRVDSQPTTEGAGVKLRRALGTRLLPMLDPFLMLDAFHSDKRDDYIAGFPDHPHRGFETVTYMLDGAMEHRDSMGNHGRLGPGSIQWMTAGHGIIHSEMPKQENGLMAGFQLWVNLPASQKLVKPRYQDLAPTTIVETNIQDAHVRLIAGEANGLRGPVEGIVTAPQMLDVKLGARGKFAHGIADTHNAFVYVFEGAIEFGKDRTLVTQGQIAVFGEGDLVNAVGGENGGRFLLLSGKPINEPVARYGPFVMNTEAEIRTAISDYQSGRLTQT